MNYQMFRESIGEYKLNRYMNRKEYRALLKAMKKKDKNIYDQSILNWAELNSKRQSEEANV